jgi:uncharacterized protein
VPLVDSAFREERIPEEWIDRPQFDEDLAMAEYAPDDIDRFTQYNRNEPCPCGSGKKARKCCLAKGEPPV